MKVVDIFYNRNVVGLAQRNPTNSVATGAYPKRKPWNDGCRHTCDVFVLPSISEGLPIALLEAVAAGRPIVATAIPGNSELVEYERTGLLVAIKVRNS